jgi:Alternative complex III, ActD subunit
MSESVEIIGAFTDDGQCAHGIRALRAAKLTDLRAFAPFPSHLIEDAFERPKSKVRAFVLTGGITGVITGLALTIGTSMEWNLVAGGKPIISWPPFIIICFELMILFGGLSAVLSFMFNAEIPAMEPARGYSSRFSEDRFGIVVKCEEADAGRVETILKDAGAEEVVREAA